MVNQSQHYGGVSQVPGVTLSWGKELKKLSAPWSLCWQGAEKVSEDGFLLSFGNPLILAVSSFSILGWIWFVFIKFSLFMFFLYFQLIPLFSLFVYFVSFKTDFMGMKKCGLPGRIRMICAYVLEPLLMLPLPEYSSAGMLVYSLHGEWVPVFTIN